MNKIEFYSNLAKFQGRNGDAFLKHYGIIGQKWGQRRWQNADGTFNEEGKQRYFGSKGNKEEKVDGKAGESSKNKWPMNDLFKKAGYDYDNSDDETRELFEMEVNDIRNSYKNGNDINKLSKEFGYDKNFIQDVINSDPDQKISGLFNKTPEEKELKEAKRLVQQLNFDNGTRVLKELRNSEYGKKHIQPIYNEYEENMNKLSDKADKIIKDNPVDEIEAGIANALFKTGTNKTSITDIIESVRGQHYSSSFDEPINTERLPLLKSDEDLWTDMINYKKEFCNKIEKEFKNIYPKAKTALSYYIALSDYENDKLEKVYSMNDEEYRKYQLYYLMDGLVPEVNKKMIKKDVIEPTNKLYPKVEKIINNTNAGDPLYNWSDINNALSKLGLDSKPADELTNADWKKVYEICSQ